MAEEYQKTGQMKAEWKVSIREGSGAEKNSKDLSKKVKDS